MLRRLSASTRTLRPLLAATLLLTACSPAARIYSVDPVDPEGAPLDASGIDVLLLEDGTRRPLRPGETLVLADQAFVIEGAPQSDGSRPSERFPVVTVEAMRRMIDGNTQQWIDVLTPDDLTGFGSLPRIQRIDTADGRAIVLDPQSGLSARWSADRLMILVSSESGGEVEAIPLETIARVELFEPDLIGSTLASPAFWVVGAVAAGLAIWLAGAEDEDSLATR